jgi:hypothetical protein
VVKDKNVMTMKSYLIPDLVDVNGLRLSDIDEPAPDELVDEEEDDDEDTLEQRAIL